MNYIKHIIKKGCGYLANILFGRTEQLLTNDNLYTIPRAINDEPYIFSVFYYKNAVVKKMIKQIKYKGDKKTTEQISKVLYDYLLEDVGEKLEISNFNRPIIIPIPATKHRMKEHGFNQCERMARHIEKMDGKNFFEFSYSNLVKIKENLSQAHTKTRTDRLANIKNSFAINNPEIIKNRNIILVDDVWTTGATLKEAKSELLKAGAKEVVAYTIAH